MGVFTNIWSIITDCLMPLDDGRYVNIKIAVYVSARSAEQAVLQARPTHRI